MLCRNLTAFCGLLLLAACRTTTPVDTLSAHLRVDEAAVPAAAPAPVAPPAVQAVSPPPPEETYSLTVREVPVRDVLFALAQEARLELDIYPHVAGTLTLHAVDQPLSRLLDRIARQAEIRFERRGKVLAALPDTPYLAHYKVDYVNLVRQTSGAVATSTQIATQVNNGEGASSALDGGNVSSARVETQSENRFWASLEKAIREILELPATAAADTATPVIVHPESGIVTVRATARQHERLADYLARVEQAARRQVMIEATIVEVELSDDYQQGIDWSRLWHDERKSWTQSPPALSGTSDASQPFVLDFRARNRSGVDVVAATLRLLQAFGSTRVLSSPRLSVLNNQTALLKVVENMVYFTIKADVTPGNANNNAIIAYTTTPQTVSVGLVMTVTPQIGQDGSVILNVRPTISSISGMVKDPNPHIASALANEIPQIRTREIESVLRVESGEIAVLGGLMEDRRQYANGRVPLLGQVPLLGELFSARENRTLKSELVIFLRPVIVDAPSLAGSYAPMRDFLPDAAKLSPPAWATPLAPASPPEP